MIKSMTGFGRYEYADASRKITVEVKSVNHRYLDVNIKMPKKLNFFESAIRTLLKEYIERGKVDIYITYEDFTENNLSLQYNKALAGEYLKYLNQMAEEFGLENDIRVSTLSRYPEVFAMEEQPVDEDELWSSLEKALRGAFEPFVESRVREGENLKKDLCEKLDNMVSYVDFIEERSPQIIVEYRARLEEKLRELLADNQLDDSRIAQEVTTVDPAQMAAFAAKEGYCAKKRGSYLSIVNGIARAYGLESKAIDELSVDAVYDALLSGDMLVALEGPGHFTNGGHFIVLRGVTLTGKLLVADPASKERSLLEWDPQLVLDELSASRSSGAPLWVISPPDT